MIYWTVPEHIHKEAVRLAKKIDDLHRGQASEVIVSKDQNVVCLYCEFAFARYWGDGLWPQVHTHHTGGDDGWDYVIALQFRDGGISEFKLDVKGARITKWMPVNPMPTEEACRAKPVRADLYVMGGANIEKRKTWLVGWCWREKILNEIDAPIYNNAGMGIYARTIPVDKLWTMDDLFAIRFDRGLGQRVESPSDEAPPIALQRSLF